MRTIDEFVCLLADTGIGVLIDVREIAWSHKPGFSKKALAATLAEAGIQYVHARFAGNPKRLRRSARTHKECLSKYDALLDTSKEIVDNFEEVVQSFLVTGKRVCISCFERHPDDCHRGLLAERWKRRGRRTVEHLDPDGAPRLAVA